MPVLQSPSRLFARDQGASLTVMLYLANDTLADGHGRLQMTQHTCIAGRLLAQVIRLRI